MHATGAYSNANWMSSTLLIRVLCRGSVGQCFVLLLRFAIPAEAICQGEKNELSIRCIMQPNPLTLIGK